MTVCIAALAKEGDLPRAVVASDRMVTLGAFMEFEHARPKMSPASSYAVAMVAGDALAGTRMSQEVSASLNGTPTIEEIAQRLAGRYAETRTERLEEHILAPRGLNLATFYEGHNRFNPQITVMLDQQMAQYNLGVELLLAGVDNTGGHIYSIQNPGQPEYLHDVIGYAAVGSGAIHAIQSMVGFGHTADAEYHQTVFRVYASKRRSEVAPGVGLDTDMAVASSEGVHWLTHEELEQLRRIYEDFGQSTTAALTEQLANFSLGEATDDGSADAIAT